MTAIALAILSFITVSLVSAAMGMIKAEGDAVRRHFLVYKGEIYQVRLPPNSKEER